MVYAYRTPKIYELSILTLTGESHQNQSGETVQSASSSRPITERDCERD